MTTFAVYVTATGVLVSVGTVVANPLPPQLTSVALSAQDAAGLANGSRRWNASLKACEATPGWVDPAIAAGNYATLSAQAITAINTNITFLAIASPTTAQVATQVKALTRQSDGVIRMLLGQLDSTAGT